MPLKVAAGGEEVNAENLKSRDFGESNRYAKLRPEADQQLLQTGTGKLYLGFRQDPVLGAAWTSPATRKRVGAKPLSRSSPCGSNRLEQPAWSMVEVTSPAVVHVRVAARPVAAADSKAEAPGVLAKAVADNAVLPDAPLACSD